MLNPVYRTQQILIAPGVYRVGPLIGFEEDQGLAADLIVDMAGVATGVTMTTAMYNAGCHGATVGSSTLSPATPTGMTVAAGANRLHTNFVVNGVTYAAGNTSSQRIALVNANSFTTATRFFPAGKRKATISGFVTLNAPGLEWSLYDLIRTNGASGGYVVMQLYTTNAPGYSINIETNAGGTIHSSYTIVTVGATYWFSLLSDFTGGTARLQMFETSGWTKVVDTSLTQPTGEDLQKWDLGNAEGGNGTGTNYFENIVVDYTNAVFPLGP